MKAEIRAYLKACLPTGEELQRLVAGTGPDGVHPNRGWVYDAELGFVHAPSIHGGDGVDGTNTFYDYEEDGARRLINCPDRPCRVHTYGDSFTHCDQVNDGETWQEYLAAHLREPIRNYGVGGYSVYQAYRRMRTVRDAGQRAQYVILNIYSDDHYRNLVSWRRSRPARTGRFGVQTRPHLRVHVRTNTCVERDNPIATADDLQPTVRSRLRVRRIRRGSAGVSRAGERRPRVRGRSPISSRRASASASRCRPELPTISEPPSRPCLPRRPCSRRNTS